jgi:hypothetical protein
VDVKRALVPSVIVQTSEPVPLFVSEAKMEKLNTPEGAAGIPDTTSDVAPNTSPPGSEPVIVKVTRPVAPATRTGDAYGNPIVAKASGQVTFRPFGRGDIVLFSDKLADAPEVSATVNRKSKKPGSVGLPSMEIKNNDPVMGETVTVKLAGKLPSRTAEAIGPFEFTFTKYVGIGSFTTPFGNGSGDTKVGAKPSVREQDADAVDPRDVVIVMSYKYVCRDALPEEFPESAPKGTEVFQNNPRGSEPLLSCTLYVSPTSTVTVASE